MHATRVTRPDRERSHHMRGEGLVEGSAPRRVRARERYRHVRGEGLGCCYACIAHAHMQHAAGQGGSAARPAVNIKMASNIASGKRPNAEPGETRAAPKFEYVRTACSI